MNTWLAQMFGTAPAPAAPAPSEKVAMDKTAQLELFAKLAADEGIDLTRLTPQQVNALYQETFGKQAEEGEPEEGESEEHEAAEPPAKEEGEEEEKAEEKAKEEHEEKKAHVAKLAEAELMGQVMAHSFVRELNEIEKSAAGMPPALKAALEKGKGAVGAVAKHKKTVGTAAAAGAAGGAAGFAARASRKKEASAFEQLAAQNAVKVAAAAGHNADEALKRVEAVYTLGLEESQKVAFIEDTAAALHVRSLEYLERAGYPVNWEEVFGS